MTIEELKEKPIWINWYPKLNADGKISKVPIAYNGEKTSSKDVHKNTWTTFENVNGQDNRIGFILRDGICVIDIDDNNYDNPMVRDIIDTMNTYTEYSPSKNGFHLVFQVDISKVPSYYDFTGEKKLDNKYYVKNSQRDIECYISGLTNRFMTYTGNVFINKPIEERTVQLLGFLDKYMVRTTQNNNNGISNEQTLESVSQIVLDTINRSKNVEKFKKLYIEGNIEDYDNDDSSADMALCSILAFYCGNNPELIDYMFSKSKLYREKWDRPDYKYNTIKKAIILCNGNFYNKSTDLLLLNTFKEMQIEKKYKADDISIGKLFATMYKNKLRYNITHKEWFFYNGKIWIKDEQGMNAINLMKTFVSTIIQYSLSIDNEAFNKYCQKLLDIRKRELLLKDSRSNLFISQEDFDLQDNLINCQNGTFNLDTFELQPHNPNDLLTKITNVIYSPKTKCLRWEQFIDEIMEEKKDKIEYLQKILGYSLFAGNPLEIFVILYGLTRTGKGTLTSTIFYSLGDYAKNIMPNSLTVKKNKDGSTASPDIARLQGCRFLSMSEPEKDLNIDAAFLKTITGRDVITARLLHKECFDFIPQFLLFINTNYLPSITDPTVFESGRVRIIEFNRHFEEHERDTNLKDYFKEPNQLTGIFNWLLDGLKKYKKDGMNVPEEIKQETLEYRYSSDKIKLFIDNELETSNTNIGVSTVYNKYCELSQNENSPYSYIPKKVFFDYIKRQPSYRKKGTVNGQTHTYVLIGMKLK